jgi:hypothetical protein
MVGERVWWNMVGVKVQYGQGYQGMGKTADGQMTLIILLRTGRIIRK